MNKPLAAKPKRALCGFIVSLIAGTLIVVGGLWMYAVASAISNVFGGAFSGLIEYMGVSYAIMGVVFGLIVIAGAVLIFKPGKEVIGGVLVLVFSLFSMLAGGGFTIGLVLGIIGGILGILKK